MREYSHIQVEEDSKRYASLIERFPWTRRYWDYYGKPFEKVTGWFDPPLPMNDYPGWSRVFEQMCERIQGVLDKYNIPPQQFVINQSKEKFAMIRVYWHFSEIGEDGFPSGEIGHSGLTIDFHNVGKSFSGFGAVSAEEMGFDKKYDEAREEIAEVLRDIAEKSYTTCMFCGSTDNIGYTQGWVMPVCSKCRDAGIEGRHAYRRLVYKAYVETGKDVSKEIPESAARD